MIFLGKTRKNAGIEKEERGTNWPETTGKGKGKTGNVQREGQVRYVHGYSKEDGKYTGM